MDGGYIPTYRMAVPSVYSIRIVILALSGLLWKTQSDKKSMRMSRENVLLISSRLMAFAVQARVPRFSSDSGNAQNRPGIAGKCYFECLGL